MNSVVLLSGGLDSAVCIALAKNDGRDLQGLHVQYGQRNAFEEQQAATAVAKYYDTPLTVVQTQLWGLSSSGTYYVPGRNTVLLALAAAFAEVLGGDLWIGCNQDDWADYPDCRPEFLNAMREVIKRPIVAPLLHLTKHEVVNYARSLNVPVHLTWTCYQPQNGQACGVCNACKLRMSATD